MRQVCQYPNLIGININVEYLLQPAKTNNTPLLFAGRCLYLCNTTVKFTASLGKHLYPKQTSALGGWDLRSGSRFPKGVGFPCVLLTQVINHDHLIIWAGVAVGIIPASLMGSPYSYLICI